MPLRRAATKAAAMSRRVSFITAEVCPNWPVREKPAKIVDYPKFAAAFQLQFREFVFEPAELQ
jgi:hypothetical protein